MLLDWTDVRHHRLYVTRIHGAFALHNVGRVGERLELRRFLLVANRHGIRMLLLKQPALVFLNLCKTFKRGFDLIGDLVVLSTSIDHAWRSLRLRNSIVLFNLLHSPHHFETEGGNFSLGAERLPESRCLLAAGNCSLLLLPPNKKVRRQILLLLLC